MKRTSPSLIEDRIAARSPACCTAGPEVSRSAPWTSAAMIIASVVLPRPGGPAMSTWSGGRRRAAAASSTSESWSRTTRWPMNSARRRGRSAASTARSGSWTWASRSCSSAASSLASGRSATACASQQLERGAQHRAGVLGVDGAALDHLVGGRLGLLGGPAEADERGDDVGAAARGRGRSLGAAAERGAEPVPQLEQDAPRALVADAGHLDERLVVLVRDGGAQPVGGVHGEHRQREPGADAADGLQGLEDVPLV